MQKTQVQKNISVIPSARRERSFNLKKIISQRWLHFLVLPAFIITLIFHYVPIYGLVIAFKNYNVAKGILGSPWVGLKWFQLFIENPMFYRLFKNTFLLGFYSILWGFPAPILLALLLNEITHARFKRLVQTVSYLPHFISIVIIVGMLKTFASIDNGLFNQVMAFMGKEPVNFFAEAEYFRTLFVASDIWQQAGWGSIVYLAALSGVDEQMYEAALMDGANRWHKLWYITLPSLVPTITILFIMRVGHIFGANFEKVLLMQNPQTYAMSDVISTYVYREGIEGGRFSYTSAVGLFMSIISFIFLYTTNKLSKKFSENSLW